MAKTYEQIKQEAQAISSATTENKVTAENLGTALQDQLDYVADAEFYNDLNRNEFWEKGYINGTGANVASDTRLRTITYIPDSVSKIVFVQGQYGICVYENDVFKGGYNGVSVGTLTLMKESVDLYELKKEHPTYKFRIYLAGANAAPEHIKMLHKFNVAPADEARAIGDAVTREEYNDASIWSNGYYNSKGNWVSDDARRTSSYLDNNVQYIRIGKGLNTAVIAFTQDDVFVGYVNPNTHDISTSTVYKTFDHNLRLIRNRYPNYKFKLLVSIVGTGGGSEHLYSKITTDICVNSVSLCNDMFKAINNRRPVISFIDDDGGAVQLDNWLDIYLSCGVRPSMAMTGNAVHNEITVEKMRHLYTLGFDFISHTHDHVNLSTLTEEQLHDEMKASIKDFTDIGMPTRFVVTPLNKTNDLVRQVVPKYFTGMTRGGNIHPTPSLNVNCVNKVPINRGDLIRVSFLSNTEKYEVVKDGVTYECGAPLSLEELDNTLQQLIESNGWLIFMTHFRDSAQYDHYYYDERYKNAVIELAKYAYSKGIDILPVSEAYPRFANKLEVGRPGDDSFYIIGPDGWKYEKNL